MKVVPFDPSHLHGFVPQPGQAEDFSVQQDAPAAQFGEAWTVFADGRAICCAGIAPIWPGRAYAWALLSVHAGPHMIGLTKLVRWVVAMSPHERVELYTDAGFPEALRWAEMLGFTRETERPMRKYLPGGRDAHLFARVK